MEPFSFPFFCSLKLIPCFLLSFFFFLCCLWNDLFMLVPTLSCCLQFIQGRLPLRYFLHFLENIANVALMFMNISVVFLKFALFQAYS